MHAVGSVSPRRRVLVVALAVAVALGVVAALVAGLAGTGGPGTGPVASGEAPVLVVPGYNGTPASVGTLAARLRSAGRRVVVVDLPDRGTGDLRASATALGRAVDRTGAARVDLVGYSAGGVVVRLWLADPARALRARRVVLLGTPNHGTELAGGAAAALGPGLCASICQLAPGSALLAELNRGDETPPGPQFFSIWTALDQTVIPPATATLDGAANIRVQDVCPSARLGHGDLVTASLALGLVVEALEGTLPDPPGPGDCAALRAVGAAVAGEPG
jgi:triacylglycerol lipase